MVIDAHFHLDEGLLTIPQMLQKMDGAGIDRTAIMASMVDPFPEPPAIIASMGQFMLKHRTFRRIGEALTSNFTPDGGINILGKVFKIYPDPDNRPIFQVAEQYPDRFLAWAFVNPMGMNDPLTEAKKWINHPACIGIKAHPFWHRYEPAHLIEVAALAAKNKPLIIHAGFGKHGNFFPLVKEVPKLKLILAHCAFPEFRDTWQKILKMETIFLDLSQTSYVSSRTIRQVIDLLGPERCIFGTDGPFGIHGDDDLFDYSVIKTRIETLITDAGARRRILGENFAELTGLKD